MSDTRKKDSQIPPKTPNEDEDIIELVEEVDEEGPAHPLSDLERRLLDLGGGGNTADGALADLPDIADLGRIDFEEVEDEEEGLSSPEAEAEAAGVSAGQDAARRFGWDAEPGSAAADEGTAAPSDEIEEISEFDEQFLEAEEILENLPAPPEDASSGEDEGLELLDIEDDDADDEIVWFDDLDKPDLEAPPPEQSPEAVPPEAPLPRAEAEPIPDTSAADVFSAHLETARTDAETEARPAATAAGAGAALEASVEAAVRAALDSPPAMRPPAAVDESPAAAPGLAPEEIEAAVERVIVRKLGGTIEAIILQAIEKAVSKEIERLKGLLLEEEDDDRTP